MSCLWPACAPSAAPAVDVVPSELLQSIEVSKALTPDVDGDSIGGSVNLVMKQAPEKLRLFGSGGGGYTELVSSYQNSNYSATALLVRDRLMAALAAREQPLSAAPALSDDARAARQELAAIEAANTWLRCPVLIRTGGVLISSRLTSKWTGSSDDSLTPLETSRRVADAEREEFVRRNLDAALRTYREALSWSGGSVATRAFLLTRLGRTSANAQARASRRRR